ncbi:MAG: hypothetical protein ACRDNZ_23380 [Streptosporangiaceae bacterium]
MTVHDRRVILHIGEPKTGTTFLQQVMWRNREELAGAGVLLPGRHAQDHFRAQNDLRGLTKLPGDPAESWAAEWDVLARQAAHTPGVCVISHELFSAADAGQAQRAIESLRPARVHVVLTVRDMASLLPAEWQESVKHRTTRAWTDWLADVIDIESVAPDRRQHWFWRVHDTLEILAIWSRLLPPEQVHVITVPPQGSGNALLWERFAGLLGVDPASVDTSRARPNASLGVAETEFLRQLNMALSPEIPDWFYMWNVKEPLAHQALAARPRGQRLVLPGDRSAWTASQAEILIAGLRESRCDVIGDLDELRPRPASAPAVRPDEAPASELLSAAVAATAAAVLNHYQARYPAVRPQQAPSTPLRLVSRVESKSRAVDLVKRAVRDLSGRYPAVRQLRVRVWQATERRRVRRNSAHD